MSVLALAGRYAKALFELAAQDGSSEKVEADLLQLMKIINESPALGNILKNPAISKGSLAKVLSELLRRMGASGFSTRFVMILIQNGRVKYLAEVTAEFSGLMMKKRGEENAYITTASTLKDSQVHEVEQALGKVLGSKIKAVIAVNDEILGGIIVRIGSKMLDASVSGQLERLSILNRKAIANLN
jgi:F-type H+-transporting ATPase subunit delta